MYKLTVNLCVAAGMISMVLAALCTPSAIGRLFSFHEYSQLFTSKELTLYRIALALAGSAMLAAVGVWLASQNAVWRKRLEKDYAEFGNNPPLLHPAGAPVVKVWSVITLVVLLALIQTIRWSTIYHGKNVRWYDILALESGLWETLTAVGLFIAGMLLVLAVAKFNKAFGLKAARWPALILGLTLLCGAGEEISCGQHWFGFATPAFLKAINTKNEFNLHNIESAFVNHLMVLFFLFYVGLLPVLGRFFKEVRYVLERLNIPLCPARFAPYAFIGALMSDYRLFAGLWGNPGWKIQKARETVFSTIMLGMSILFYLNWKYRFAHKAD